MAEPNEPLLSLRDVDVVLGHGIRAAHVLHGVSFDVQRGSSVALVGESGSGKSTIARAIMGIHRARSGSIRFDGIDLVRANRRQKWGVRRRIQLIPQDPFSSLDPRRTVGQTLAEAISPLGASVRSHRAKISEALDAVSLPATAAGRYPHEFSGGQRQRIAIARALVTDPEMIIADEITSALDVSTQAEILTLLKRLRADFSLTMVFISHNLAVVHDLCDSIVVLLHGDVVEVGNTESVFRSPSSEYTRELIESVPGGPAFRLEGAR